MSQEDYIDASKIIEAVEQGRIQFFLEAQSAELELKVASQKESDDAKIYILGSFEGAGLDSLYTLKVKIGNEPSDPTDPDASLGSRGGSGDPSGGSGGSTSNPSGGSSGSGGRGL